MELGKDAGSNHDEKLLQGDDDYTCDLVEVYGSAEDNYTSRPQSAAGHASAISKEGDRLMESKEEGHFTSMEGKDEEQLIREEETASTQSEENYVHHTLKVSHLNKFKLPENYPQTIADIIRSLTLEDNLLDTLRPRLTQTLRIRYNDVNLS